MNKNIEPVYSFSNFQDYLSTATKHFLSRSQRPYSLSQWAKKLGYSSPRIVGMVLKGQRIPSSQMTRAWSQALEHDLKQQRYFELLVRMAREQKNNKPVVDILRELETISPKKSAKLVLDAKEFSFVADWYHLVIKQLASVKNQKMDENSLYIKMRNKVTRAEIRKALENLVSLGIISKKNRSDQYNVLKDSFTTTNDIPSEAIRLHHKQMMQRAQESLEEQNVFEREITSSTLRFDVDRMNEVKQAIRDFKENFERNFGSSEANHIYQFNMQFFSHTDLKNKGTQNE